MLDITMHKEWSKTFTMSLINYQNCPNYQNCKKDMEENIKNIPNDITKRRIGYLNLSASLEKDFHTRRIRVIDSHKDTLKNLALIAGAVATFSLMLLDSEVPKIQILLIIGSTFLLLSALISFLYLLCVNE